VKGSSRKKNPSTGYELTFFTLQERRHKGEPLGHWLVEEARTMGIGGATLVAANEGFGHHGRIHAMHLFDLTEQPHAIIMAVTRDEADRLFERLREEGIEVFYCKVAIEFGTTGGNH
jgi:PII-like signaling protein